MKILPCILFCLVSPLLHADDLFYADGKKTVVRTLNTGRQTLTNVQIGVRTAEGLIEIYHSKGVTAVRPDTLPKLWLAALARREGEQLAPNIKPAPAGQKSDIKQKIGKCIQEATIHLVAPVYLLERKSSDKDFFNGYLLAIGPDRFLICDGQTVAWVDRTYFVSPGDISALVTEKNSPELHAAARKKADTKAWGKGRGEWPDDNHMQAFVHDLEMTAWDKQYPKPQTKDAAFLSIEPPHPDPFAAKE